VHAPVSSKPPAHPDGVFTVRPFDRLSVKQAIATFAIAVVLGLAAGAWELLADYRGRHEQVRAATVADLNLVRGLAIEAAYQLSAELAGEVVAGLAHDEAVVGVRLADNYGGVLGKVERRPVATSLPGIAQALFGDIARHELVLEVRAADGTVSTVGNLTLTLDPGYLLDSFLDRLVAILLGGAARAAVLCALVVGIFYVLITKPLLRITAAIATVDPAQPGAFLVSVPKRHERDELGLLAGTVNRMLTGSQFGLDGRDRAEAELAALARELEQRVEDRTRELAREKEEVERALAQLNQANQELEAAHHHINDGIGYASRIQTALLPDAASLEGLVEDIAIGWQPLDVVGGDYYWLGRFGAKGVVAVMDCTGHGVPGAFMTAVVSSILSRVLQHHGHEDPAAILGHVNLLVKAALRQDRSGAVSNDGLDAGICVFDGDADTINFAGANLPLLISGNGGFRVVRGDRMSLGYADSPEGYRFTNHTLDVVKGDTFILYTDGVTDQVGGPNRRLLGRRRVQETLAEGAGLPLTEQMERLFRRLEDWRGTERRRDDMTYVAFRPRVG